MLTAKHAGAWDRRSRCPRSYLIRKASILRYARPLKGGQGECELVAAMPRGEQPVVCVRRIRDGEPSAGKLGEMPPWHYFRIPTIRR